MGATLTDMDLAPDLTPKEAGGVHLLVDGKALDAGILVAFADRRGGVSAAPFDTLNLATRVGDDRHAVLTNRARAAAAAGFDPDKLALAKQVHRADVLEVDAGQSGVLGEADALIARVPGPVLAILTADCTPVVLAGPSGVAIVHAGWRGLVAGVIERTAERLGEVVAAWVGPAIHACCYEVGPEVVDAFERADLPVAGASSVDPGRAATAALHRLGVQRVAASTECTSCNANYFSFRRDGLTGRQGAFVALVGDRM